MSQHQIEPAVLLGIATALGVFRRRLVSRLGQDDALVREVIGVEATLGLYARDPNADTVVNALAELSAVAAEYDLAISVLTRERARGGGG